MLQTLIAVLDLCLLSRNTVQKCILDGTSRHTYRTLGDDDILLLRIDVCLLVSHGRVALLGGHKPGSHLHAVRSQLQRMHHILMGVDTTCDRYRDMGLILVLILLYHLHDAADFFVVGILSVGCNHVIRVRAVLSKLFSGKAQMTACQRPLDH